MDARKFTTWNPHNEHKAFYMAHNVLYDMANDYFTAIERNPKNLVHIKGRDVLTQDKTKVSGRYPWFSNPQYYFPKWTRVGRAAELDMKCERWFFKNCEPMIQGMFHCNGWKDIEEAIKNTVSYKELCYVWDEWFLIRRRHFMEKQNNLIKKKTGVPAKMPSSQGGVANLLKVLTKTMIMQGSSVRTIAKVQYSICQQAGIYIPSEFLTDVAIVVDYEDQINELKG